MGDENNAMVDLEAAWDASASTEEVAEVTPNEPDTGIQSDQHISAEPITPEGAGAVAAEVPGGQPGEEPGAAPAGEAPSEKPTEPDVGSPVGLSAEAKAAWKDTPKAVQSEIVRRETDFARGIQKYAEGAKRAQAMDNALAPYQQYFAMNGNKPGETINQLLQTASLLQMGSPAQKVQQVAGLIQQFGIDIPALDQFLTSGHVPPEVQQQSNTQTEIQKALQPYQQFMQEVQQGRQAQEQGRVREAGSEVAAFAQNSANEFYETVKMDMADILDMNSQRGINLTLKDAYDRACAMHPQINGVIQSRIQQSALTAKRQAAASVTGNQGGPGTAAVPGSRLDALSEAWDNAGRT